MISIKSLILVFLEVCHMAVKVLKWLITPPPSSFLLVQQTSAVFMSYLVVRLCGGVEGSGISVVVVNVPHNSTLAALDQ